MKTANQKLCSGHVNQVVYKNIALYNVFYFFGKNIALVNNIKNVISYFIFEIHIFLDKQTVRSCDHHRQVNKQTRSTIEFMKINVDLDVNITLTKV